MFDDRRIRNFRVVRDGLYRSGKYQACGLKAVVEKYQVDTVVDLRDAHRRQLLADATYLKIGVRFVRIPVCEYSVFSEDVFQDVLLRIASGRVLLHCWKGCHRTGAIVACYRVHSGWSSERAMAEMESCGFGKRSSHESLWNFVNGGCAWH